MNLTLSLSPVRSDKERLAVAVNGTVITVEGADYDLSLIPDGATVQHPVLNEVTRDGDNYSIHYRLYHGPNAPQETRFPEPIVLTDHNGPVDLPPYNGGAA